MLDRKRMTYCLGWMYILYIKSTLKKVRPLTQNFYQICYQSLYTIEIWRSYVANQKLKILTLLGALTPNWVPESKSSFRYDIYDAIKVHSIRISNPCVEKQFFLFFYFQDPASKKGAPDQNSGRSHFSVLVRTTQPEKMNILAQIL